MSKVSVIIPVYNVEKYLCECLDSVVNQTLKDIEIICVNDGSTDGSLAILEEYARKDERIRIFNQKNSGAAAARNLGIEKACGEYLSILDSDDYFEADMLEKLYNRCEKDDLDCTVCRCRILDDTRKKIKNADFSIRKDWLPEKEIFNYKDMPQHIFGFCVGWSWDKLYKREFVIKNKLQFQNLRSTNDMLFVFMSLVLAERIGVVDDVLITHRQNRPEQLSETRERDPLCFIEAVYELKRQLKEKGIFKEVEQSFDNWSLNFCFWHLNTLKNPEKKILEKKLKNEVFPRLGFYSKERGYFYNKCDYKRLQEIKGVGKWQQIFSVRNENNHKVLTILGVRFKFRRKNKNINEYKLT